MNHIPLAIKLPRKHPLRLNGFIFLVFFFLGVTNILAQSPQPLPLQELIWEALRNNPQLKAYRDLSKASRAQISPAGSLPDPLLSLRVLNVPDNHLAFNREAMSGKQISLTQSFPFPGKLLLKSAIARSRAETNEANLQEMKNALIKEVKETYYELYYIDQAIRTTQKNKALLSELVKIATVKYSVGKGLQQDVLKAQVEMARLNDRLLVLEQKRTVLTARLNRLLNRRDNPPIVPVIPSSLPAPHFARDTLLIQMQKKRPLLLLWQKRLQESKEKSALARKNFWPDLILSLTYTQRDVLINGTGGQDFISFGISFRLPIFAHRKQNKQIEAAFMLETGIQNTLREVRNQISEALTKTLSILKRSFRQEALYRTSVLPQARQSLMAARAGYQNGKIDFLTLVNNQMTLFQTELEYQRIISDYYKALAELEYVTGARNGE